MKEIRSSCPGRGMRRQGAVLKFGIKKSKGGFSVIEMVIVAAIIGIPASIAAPILIGTIRHSRLQYAAEELMSRFSTARSFAISRNTYSRMIFETASESYYIQTYNAESGEWEEVGQKYTLPYKVSFESSGVTFPGLYAQFDPFGSLKDGGEIEIKDKFGNSVRMVAVVSNGQLNKADD